MELASGMVWFGDSTIASFKDANENGVVYECREDVVAVNFLTLVILSVINIAVI